MINIGPCFQASAIPTPEQVLAACEFKPLSDNDRECLMSMKEFIEDVDSRCIMDYDGSGCLVIGDQLVSNSVALCCWNSFRIGDSWILPFAVLHGLFAKNVQVAWYNK